VKAFLEPWLRPSDPRALAACRLILFWCAWPGFRFGSHAAFAEFEGGPGWQGVGLPGLLHLPLAGPAGFAAVGVGITLCTGLALAGLGYRVVAPIAAFLKLYAAWVPQGAGKINHGGLLFTLVLFVIAFAPAADAWSLDAVIRRVRGRPRAEPSAEYTWAIRFIALMVVTMYGAAGLSKLIRSGLGWAFSDNLQRLLLGHQFTSDPPTMLGVSLASYPLLCRALACMALGFEITAPLALFSRTYYRVVIPGLAALQLMIWLTLGVLFREMLFVFACLLPWNAWVARADELGATSLTRFRYTRRT
jgi:hypothetical protein